MVRKAAVIVGIVFLLIGIAGFIPALTPETGDVNKLLGIFRVDAIHNLIHIVSGIAFLAVSGGIKSSKLLFQVMAVVYGLVTLVGFMVGEGGSVLGLFHTNTADNILHLLLTVAFAYLGFAKLDEHEVRPSAPAA